MATVLIEEKMPVDRPGTSGHEILHGERAELSRVRVIRHARDEGEMVGWLQWQAGDEEEEEDERIPVYRLPHFGDDYVPELREWLEERSGVDSIEWDKMVAPENVWRVVIERLA